MEITKELFEAATKFEAFDDFREFLEANGFACSEETASKVFDRMKDNSISIDELENMQANGACTSYSSGVTDPKTNVYRQYAIVTMLNQCHHGGVVCSSCKHSFTIGPTYYCRERYKGHDTYDENADRYIDD